MMNSNFLQKILTKPEQFGRNACRVMLLAAFICFIAIWRADLACAVMLLTPEEGAMQEELTAKPAGPPGTPRVEERLDIPKTPVTGPDIQILSPEPEKAYSPPLRVLVKFVPREGTRVDLSSLKVECLKIFTINITDRLREYITNNGINVDKAELPSGDHKIRITLGDSGGGMTSKVFMVKVQ